MPPARELWRHIRIIALQASARRPKYPREYPQKLDRPYNRLGRTQPKSFFGNLKLTEIVLEAVYGNTILETEAFNLSEIVGGSILAVYGADAEAIGFGKIVGDGIVGV